MIECSEQPLLVCEDSCAARGQQKVFKDRRLVLKLLLWLSAGWIRGYTGLCWVFRDGAVLGAALAVPGGRGHRSPEPGDLQARGALQSPLGLQ